jgi:hypothetical protein
MTLTRAALRRLRTAQSTMLALALALPWAAFADTADMPGDGVASVVGIRALSFGNVCANTAVWATSVTSSTSRSRLPSGRPAAHARQTSASGPKDESKQLQQRLSADIERARAELRKRVGVGR